MGKVKKRSKFIQNQKFNISRNSRELADKQRKLRKITRNAEEYNEKLLKETQEFAKEIAAECNIEFDENVTYDSRFFTYKIIENNLNKSIKNFESKEDMNEEEKTGKIQYIENIKFQLLNSVTLECLKNMTYEKISFDKCEELYNEKLNYIKNILSNVTEELQIEVDSLLKQMDVLFENFVDNNKLKENHLEYARIFLIEFFTYCKDLNSNTYFFFDNFIKHIRCFNPEAKDKFYDVFFNNIISVLSQQYLIEEEGEESDEVHIS